MHSNESLKGQLLMVYLLEGLANANKLLNRLVLLLVRTCTL